MSPPKCAVIPIAVATTSEVTVPLVSVEFLKSSIVGFKVIVKALAATLAVIG